VKQSNPASLLKPADQSDEELKMLAIQGLMNSDSENAPMAPALRESDQRCGFLQERENRKRCSCWQQSGVASRHARISWAKSRRGTEQIRKLQRKAVEYLGLFGGAEAPEERWRKFTHQSSGCFR